MRLGDILVYLGFDVHFLFWLDGEWLDKVLRTSVHFEIYLFFMLLRLLQKV